MINSEVIDLSGWLNKNVDKFNYEFNYRKYKISDFVLGEIRISTTSNSVYTNINCNSLYEDFYNLNLYRNHVYSCCSYSIHNRISDESLSKFKDHFLNWMTEKKFNSHIKKLKAKQELVFQNKIDNFFNETFISMQEINKISLKDYKDYLNKSIKKFVANQILSDGE